MVSTREKDYNVLNLFILIRSIHSFTLDHIRIQRIKPSQLDWHCVQFHVLIPAWSRNIFLLRYLLSSCAFTPLYGRLCTILGRRVACQIALTATALGTLLCGISRDMIELAIARFVCTCFLSDSFLIVQTLMDYSDSRNRRGSITVACNVGAYYREPPQFTQPRESRIVSADIYSMRVRSQSSRILSFIIDQDRGLPQAFSNLSLAVSFPFNYA